MLRVFCAGSVSGSFSSFAPARFAAVQKKRHALLEAGLLSVEASPLQRHRRSASRCAFSIFLRSASGVSLCTLVRNVKLLAAVAPSSLGTQCSVTRLLPWAVIMSRSKG